MHFYSEAERILILRCLTADPNKRPSPKELLEECRLALGRCERRLGAKPEEPAG